jgi:NAD(P)-dependent dehydrogenase (short-subunit alcohol dehydrogenase family)
VRLWPHFPVSLFFAGTPYQVHLSAARATVDATSAVLAVEEGPRGVRSNVISPGPIGGTEGMDRLTPKGSEDSWPIPIPTGRKGESRDVAMRRSSSLAMLPLYLQPDSCRRWRLSTQVSIYSGTNVALPSKRSRFSVVRTFDQVKAL